MFRIFNRYSFKSFKEKVTSMSITVKIEVSFITIQFYKNSLLYLLMIYIHKRKIIFIQSSINIIFFSIILLKFHHFYQLNQVIFLKHNSQIMIHMLIT